MSFINYIDNIKILDNNCAKQHINNITKDFLINDDDISSIKVYENCLIESKKNDNTTSYETEHLITNINNNELRPNINTLNNYFTKISNKPSLENSIIIENAVFLSSFTCFHQLPTHIMYDFSNSINMFYELLKENEDFAIIIEFINKGMICQLNLPIEFSNSLNKLTEFIKDIGLKNKIFVVSISSCYQNFDSESLFVNKLHTILFKQKYNHNWIPLLSRFCKNSKNEYFPETMKCILKNNNEINIHYNYHKQKFFILEKRLGNNSRRIITNEDTFSKIFNICQIYCYYNNLKLVIWEDVVRNNNSIYEQLNISNNAEIIIGYGGSFWYFNCANTCSKILIMNLYDEFNGKYDAIYNMTLYSFMNILKNKSIKNIFLHFKNDINECLDFDKIVYKFLYEEK